MKRFEKGLWYGLSKSGQIVIKTTDEIKEYINPEDRFHAVLDDVDYVRGPLAYKNAYRHGLTFLSRKLMEFGYR